MTVLDPWEPASSHSAQGNSPPPPALEELLTGGERLVKQVLCRELSLKPWETWTDRARSVGLCSSPGTAGSGEGFAIAWHSWAGRLLRGAASRQITALPLSR